MTYNVNSDGTVTFIRMTPRQIEREGFLSDSDLRLHGDPPRPQPAREDAPLPRWERNARRRSR